VRRTGAAWCRAARRVLDFRDSSAVGEHVIRERYGNLFEMYERITDENGYSAHAHLPRRTTPGRPVVDKQTDEQRPRLFVLGEANYSVHGANRLGASALMQGLADGYFVIPYTISGYLAGTKPGKVKADHPECARSIAEVKASTERLRSVNGKRTVTEFMRELGLLMWNNVGMARSEQSLTRPSRRSRPSARSSGRT
jgi:succinate dehydrogenase / fumarate reductase flavoprotein subunit